MTHLGSSARLVIAACVTLAVAATAQEPAALQAVEVVFEDGFEGAFPGPWLLYSEGNGTRFGASTFRAETGSRSAYCAAGGSPTSPPGGPYPPDSHPAMVYGPFSLAGATAASFSFSAWYRMAAGDNFVWGYGLDGTHFTIAPSRSGISAGWQRITYNLQAALGQPAVWVIIKFRADAVAQDEGLYVDNVRIERTVTVCSLSCSTSVPSSAATGQSVAFAASASATGCTGTPSYAWTFGDGATGSGAAANHTYSAPGTYNWTMTVTVGTSTCTRNGTITVASPCSLSCAATVPAAATAGQSVLFQASATTTGCTGAPAYAWTFGDGGTATGASANHAYGAGGTYSWGVTVSVGATTCTKNGTIAVSAAPVTLSTWVPVATHVAGSNDSQWRTDLGVLNTTGAAIPYELRFHAISGTLSVSRTVASGEQAILGDVVDLFGISGSAALEVRSAASLRVSSRTYNQAAIGTFGQGYDSFMGSAAAAAGDVVYLPQLAESGRYRTNIGLVNAGTAQAIARVELFDGGGHQVGEYDVLLPAGIWKLETRPFANRAGRTDLARGYARVTVLSGSGVLAAASVVDNATNDPTTVAMKRAPAAGATVRWIPVASHASGLEGSQWRTDLGVLSLAPSSATVELRLHTTTGVRTAALTVPPGYQAAVEDVVALFGYNGSAALEVRSTQAVVVSSRTYNQSPTGTFGQDYDSFAAADGLSAGAWAYLPQLTENDAYRSNLALVNAGAAPAVVRVELFGGDGTELVEYTLDVPAGQWRQDTRPFRSRAGQTALARGFARVTVLQGSGVVALASVIDNVTNDPTTIAMKRAGP